MSLRNFLNLACVALLLLVSGHAVAQPTWESIYQGNDGNDTLTRLISNSTSGDLVMLESEGHNGNDVRVVKLGSSGAQSWGFIHDSGDNDRPRDVIYSANGCTVLFDVYNGTDWDVRVTDFHTSGSVAWTNTFSSSADDFGAALTRSSTNQVFVVSALHNGTNYDWLVVRYNLSGAAQSAQVVDFGADDIPVGIAADNLGNVYVAGTSDDGSGSGGVNVRVAKFNSSGSVAWSVPYDGGVGTESVKDIVSDSAGNCYVLGTSETALGEDVLLLRITAAGAVDWDRRFNGGGAGNNEPGGLALEPAGGCVLSGSVYSGTDFDWFTAMYDDTGAQGWRDDVATSGVIERGMDVSVDSNGASASIGIIGSGTGTVLWTLFINNAGTRAWTDNAAYSNLTGGFVGFPSHSIPRVASTMLRDGNTDGLIRGINVGGNLDYATTAPTSAPLQIHAMATDAAGNLYVAGEKNAGSGSAFRALLVKYDSSGTQLWARVFPTNTSRWIAMAISPAGDVCLSGEAFGGTNWGAVTAQYSPAGILNWSATYSSPRGRGVDLEVDNAGNIYSLVWGRSASSPGNNDHVLVLTYDSNGTPGWTYEYNQGSANHPADMCSDSSGNLYIVGDNDTNSSASGYINYLVIKLDSSGNEQWARTRHFDGDDFARSVTVDASGNAYAAGTSGGSTTGATTVSYDSAGSFRWDDTQTQVDPATRVEILLNGNGEIYVAATVYSSSAGRNLLLARYAASGSVQGVTIHDVAGDDDIALKMAHDSQNRVYIVGSAVVSGASENAYVVRFNSAGTFEWDMNYDGGTGFPDFGRSVLIDGSDAPIIGSILNLNPQKIWSLRRLDPGQSPTDIQLSNSSVNENTSAGAVIGQFTSTDPSTGDTHTYSLVAGTGDTHNNEFSVVGDELRVAVAPDYEAGNTRSIRVRTTDSTALFFEKIFQISVNDLNESPTGVSMTSLTVDENRPSAELVGQLSSTDPDAADTHNYTLVSGAGSTNNNLFTISTRDVLTLTILDYESTPTLSIRVRSTDAGGLFTEQAFTINVQDQNDAPTGVTLGTSSISEFQPVGTTVGTLTAVDADVSDSHSYALVSGTGSSGNGSFVIVGDELQSATIFDTSIQTSYSIRVRATDSGTAFIEQILTITVTPFEAPSNITLSSAAIAENQPAGTVIGSLTATDPTVGDTHTFSMASGVGDTDNSLFSIVGNILMSSGPFDFESRNSLSIRIRATDSTALTFEKVFIITVNDLPESGGGGDSKEEDRGCPASTNGSDGQRLFALLLLCTVALLARALSRRGDRRSSHPVR